MNDQEKRELAQSVEPSLPRWRDKRMDEISRWEIISLAGWLAALFVGVVILQYLWIACR